MSVSNSFKTQLEAILNKIVLSNPLHAKWLNTLSYLENCGARKIAACEHQTLVKEEMLQHAAEEFRHAHYLKRQIKKISIESFPTYASCYLLGGVSTLHYLDFLDIQTSRYLKSKGLSTQEIKKLAYLLVTYAIELRAEALYSIYEAILCRMNSKVTVKSILLEEEQHLHEMKEGLKAIPEGDVHAKSICAIEEKMFNKWMDSIKSCLEGCMN